MNTQSPLKLATFRVKFALIPVKAHSHRKTFEYSKTIQATGIVHASIGMMRQTFVPATHYMVIDQVTAL